jgi:hypothetical protein
MLATQPYLDLLSAKESLSFAPCHVWLYLLLFAKSLHPWSVLVVDLGGGYIGPFASFQDPFGPPTSLKTYSRIGKG